MTKIEKQKLQNLYNEISNVRKEQELSFKRLQELNASLGNYKWCCAMQNFKEIIKSTNNSKIIFQAEQAIFQYIKTEGEFRMLTELGYTLVHLGFLHNKD